MSTILNPTKNADQHVRKFDGEERRSFGVRVEMRADDQYFGGLGAVYYDGTPATQASPYGDMIERFMPGCFNDFLASDEECLSLFDHDTDCLLGRRSSGTLQLQSVAAGLDYQVKYDQNDPDHQRVLSKIKRGDVRGSSIIFRVLPDGETWSMENNVYVRSITRCWICDIGPTPIPVYDATTAEPRSRDAILARARQALMTPPLDIEFWRPE